MREVFAGALRPGGTLMVVEPAAGDRLAENLNPVGRLFYGASTLICTPNSLSQPGARALGPQAGPARLTALLSAAGFDGCGLPRRTRSTSSSRRGAARPDRRSREHSTDSTTDDTTSTARSTGTSTAKE